MRNAPIDAGRVKMISTGTVSAVDEWVKLSDDTRRRSGNQAKDENGRLLWNVEVIVPGDDSDRTEVTRVTVAGDEPKPGSFGDLVEFVGLVMRVWVTRDGKLGQGFTADGIKPRGAMARPSEGKAA